MVLVRLKHAAVVLQQRTLLEQISLEIQSGDVLQVIGANGSGKSTLLKLLAGQHWHTSGLREYHFSQPPRASPIGASLALVAPELQERYQRLEHNRTVLEVLSTGFAQTDFLQAPLEPKQHNQMLELVGQLHLSELLDRMFFVLSKGQMRQVLMARALLSEPKLLLLDEFFSGVDELARQRLRQAVAYFLEQGGTLVYTTHREEPPFSKKERLLTLESGRLVKKKPPRQRQLQPKAQPSSTANLRQVPLIEIHRADVFLSRPEDDATAIDGNSQVAAFHALKNIDFTLLEGQHWLISGHNGAGKSTFAKLLRGDVAPAFGAEVRWFGTLSMPIWQRQQRIALVSSDLQHLHRVDATGFEIIASGFFSAVGWHHHLEPDQQTRVRWLAKALEVEYLLQRNALYASQGELRKLLLARALVTQPSIILLDEAFDYLDTASRRLVWTVLLEQPATLLIIAHRREDEPPFAVRHLELENGAIKSIS